MFRFGRKRSHTPNPPHPQPLNGVGTPVPCPASALNFTSQSSQKTVNFAESDFSSPVDPGLTPVDDLLLLNVSPFDSCHSGKQASRASADRENFRVLERHLPHLTRSLYLNRRDLSIAVCTWNVSEADAQKVDDIERWLHAKSGVDIIAVGLQEVDMSAVSLATSSTDKTDPWLDCLNRSIIPHQYRRLQCNSLVGTLIAVFIKSELYSKVENLTTKLVKLGVGGLAGNKGALAVGFTVFCKRFLFVTSHFCPHSENAEKRNDNYHFVLNNFTQQLNNSTPTNDCVCNSLVMSSSTSKSKRESLDGGSGFFSPPKFKAHSNGSSQSHSLLNQVDYLFWFGDLNYRVEHNYEDVMEAIAQQKPQNILRWDQLNRERELGKVFGGFEEAPINFLPTYKYLKGRNIYDTSKRGGKRRLPSYTDRVLWYQMKTGSSSDFLPPESNVVTALKYSSYPSTVSDHLPVCCVFKVAGYAPLAPVIDRVIDLANIGMSSPQINATISSENSPSCTNTMEDLYSHIPDDELYYSDDGGADCELTLEHRLSAVENLLKSGPLPGDDTLDEIKARQTGLQTKVEGLSQQLCEAEHQSNRTEHEDTVKQSVAHVLRQLTSVEALIKMGVSDTEEKESLKAIKDLQRQFGHVASRMEMFISTLGNTMKGATADYVGFPEGLGKLSEERLQQAYLAGVSKGLSTKQDGLNNRHDQMEATDGLLKELSLKEKQCEKREKEIKKKEEIVSQKIDFLRTLKSEVDTQRVQQLKLAEYCHGVVPEVSKHAPVSKDGQALGDLVTEVQEQELRLIQQGKLLVRQRTHYRQELEELEINRESFCSQMIQREEILRRREALLNHDEERLHQKFSRLRAEITRDDGHSLPHRTVEWKGVLERTPKSQWPASIRGTFHQQGNPASGGYDLGDCQSSNKRSQSPLNALLEKHNLHQVSDQNQPSSVGAGVSGNGCRLRDKPTCQTQTQTKSIPQSPASHSSAGSGSLESKTVTVEAYERDKLSFSLQKYMNKAQLPSNFRRVGPGESGACVYLFGTRHITIRLMSVVKKEDPHVLIGGGWMPFAEFLAKFGAAEQRRLSRSRQ